MELLLFAEGAVVLLALERFLRIVLAQEASNQDTLPNLLEKAFSRRLKLLAPPADPTSFVRRVKQVRNTILHGNYEQAAAETGCTSVGEYFKLHYTPEVERLFEILQSLMDQIDVRTGEPVSDSEGPGRA